MASFPPGPGDDIDAWCGKCLMVMSHRIIAIVGSQVKKVECLTCHAIHAYKPATAEKNKVRAPRTASVGSTRVPKLVTPKPGKLENEWKLFMAEKPEEGVLHQYRVSESFSVSEYIEHPTFGTGKVLEITGADRMLVVFKDGRKTLICNRLKTP